MLFYSLEETLGIVLAAIVVDLCIGDPKWPTHPVVLLGRFIAWMEHQLRQGHEAKGKATAEQSQRALIRRGAVLAVSTTALSCGMMGVLIEAAAWIHPWLGYAASVWFVSTTIAVKGLKDAAYRVLRPLREGNLTDARKYTGYIVGRDTAELPESELTRAVVETVAENTVDAFVSPVFYALLGGAPLAMLYRSANTLDSMVGYRDERYLFFGRVSARLDDVLNWIPARITGLLLTLAALWQPGLSAKRSLRSISRFAGLHPSPNSGIPEAAVAGAIGIELGGQNAYGGVVSERARLGWPLRERTMDDITMAVRMLYGTSFAIMGGLVCTLMLIHLP